jgi:hypothetical protein
LAPISTPITVHIAAGRNSGRRPMASAEPNVKVRKIVSQKRGRPR